VIDPVSLAVIRGRLEQIVDEMDATLFRAAFSPVIAEARVRFGSTMVGKLRGSTIGWPCPWAPAFLSRRSSSNQTQLFLSTPASAPKSTGSAICW